MNTIHFVIKTVANIVKSLNAKSFFKGKLALFFVILLFNSLFPGL